VSFCFCSMPVHLRPVCQVHLLLPQVLASLPVGRVFGGVIFVPPPVCAGRAVSWSRSVPRVLTGPVAERHFLLCFETGAGRLFTRRLPPFFLNSLLFPFGFRGRKTRVFVLWLRESQCRLPPHVPVGAPRYHWRSISLQDSLVTAFFTPPPATADPPNSGKRTLLVGPLSDLATPV